MSDDNITTSTLLGRLLKTHSIQRFIKHYDEQMSRVSLKKYINQLCAEMDTIPVRIIEKSGIETNYGYQLFNGTRKKPSRDKVIQLAFGFTMNLKNAQELLKVARKSPLYPKVRRDSVIIYALEKGYSIGDVQDTLDELGLPILGSEVDEK